MVAAIGGFQTRKDSFVTIGGVMTLLIAIATVVSYRQYKGFATFASTHSLELHDDMIVLRSGEVETRIPYQSVRQMRVARSLQTPTQITLRLEDGSKTMLDGYSDMRRLVEGIAQHLDPERVEVGWWYRV